jgi:hypothetical protein
MRSTSDEYVYDTSHVIRTIEDDLSAESKKVAEDKLAEELIIYNKWKNSIQTKETVKKKWYHFGR